MGQSVRRWRAEQEKSAEMAPANETEKVYATEGLKNYWAKKKKKTEQLKKYWDGKERVPQDGRHDYVPTGNPVGRPKSGKPPKVPSGKPRGRPKKEASK